MNTRSTWINGQTFNLADAEILELAAATHPERVDDLERSLSVMYDTDDRLLDFDLDAWREVTDD